MIRLPCYRYPHLLDAETSAGLPEGPFEDGLTLPVSLCLDQALGGITGVTSTRIDRPCVAMLLLLLLFIVFPHILTIWLALCEGAIGLVPEGYM